MSIDAPQSNGSSQAGGIVPPQDLEAEQSVLGALMLGGGSIAELHVEVALRPEDFYRENHGRIFAAMQALESRNEPIDHVTVADYLQQAGELERVGGRAALEGLTVAVPALAHVRQYAKIVKERALLRRLLTATYEIQQTVHRQAQPAKDLVDLAERSILQVAEQDRAKDFRSVHDVLQTELDRLVKVSKDGAAITGTPSGFVDLDNITGGFQAGNLIILAARPSMGKCLPGAALIHDPSTGDRRPLIDVVEALERGEHVSVTSVDADLRVVPARAVRAVRNGTRPMLRVRTKLGRTIEATDNHPFLTVLGWRPLGELSAGSRIALPRRLPEPPAPESLPDHEIVLLAALIADGNLTERSPRFCSGAGSPVLPIVDAAARALGVRISSSSGGTAILSNGRGSTGNPVSELMRRHGQWGRRPGTKFVPDAIFRLSNAQIARFLSVLYACDGHIHVGKTLREIGYTTISPSLATGVQHLLLRLGIVAKLRVLRRPVYDGTGTRAYEVLITGQTDLARFCGLVDVIGKSDRLMRVLQGLAGVRAKSNVDTLPPEAWALASAAKGRQPWARVSETAGRPSNHDWHIGRRGMSRPLAGEPAAARPSPELERLATSDLWWDEIVTIDEAGAVETFDIEVPGLHNFVADDIVVHNSALMANFCENAALGDGRPVALFSLEMSEIELAQRFIASQASVPGDDLRKGRVAASRWNKIYEASNRLAQSKLYIDDSSELSVLDVRAKARRLAQQHDEKLGLVVIDYLQLMRADGSVDNRVEQIGQISRGLKTLARELECPVVALSQLNRGVEQRTDKRPVLSDLRESGCLTGDTPIQLETGERRPLRELSGQAPVDVLALNTQTWQLQRATATHAFCTGTKPVFELVTQLGRRVRATANHRFLTFDGWKRLDELAAGMHLALPRQMPAGDGAGPTAEELALLGHLIGDGSTLPRHALQVTTDEQDVAQEIARLAGAVFGEQVRPRISRARSWFQVYLAAAETLGHGRRNPIAAWLDELGVFGLRSHEKRVPGTVFRADPTGVAVFLRHLWSTDGCVWSSDGDSRPRWRVYYATSSRELAEGVQHLLLRLGICARLARHAQAGGRDEFHVDVSGRDDVLRFAEVVGAVGARRAAALTLITERVGSVTANTNRDVIPNAAWRQLVVPAMTAGGVTTRQLQAGLGMSYCGGTLYRTNLSRERALRVAAIAASPELAALAAGDVYWDRVATIAPAGEEPVFDLTVPGLHNFVAGDIVVHNSIEQDADLVMFIYRDEYYHEDSEDQGIAELIISKHRNGGLGKVKLTFQNQYPRFMAYAGDPYE